MKAQILLKLGDVIPKECIGWCKIHFNCLQVWVEDTKQEDFFVAQVIDDYNFYYHILSNVLGVIPFTFHIKEKPQNHY